MVGIGSPDRLTTQNPSKAGIAKQGMARHTVRYTANYRTLNPHHQLKILFLNDEFISAIFKSIKMKCRVEIQGQTMSLIGTPSGNQFMLSP